MRDWSLLWACLGIACAGPEGRSRVGEKSSVGGRANPVASSVSSAPQVLPSPTLTPFDDLAELHFADINSERRVSVRLYDAAGEIDERAAAELDELCADRRRKGEVWTRPIERRLLQIVARSAYYYGKQTIEVVSCYRRAKGRREGYHEQGRAMDFRVVGVDSKVLASYLRKIPRLGVGVYTHPRTQYVHLDVRQSSYHWLDASPPGKRWRGLSLGGNGLVAMDAGYLRADDWPEGVWARFGGARVLQ